MELNSVFQLAPAFITAICGFPGAAEGEQALQQVQPRHFLHPGPGQEPSPYTFTLLHPGTDGTPM